MAIRIVEGFNILQGINSRNGFSINEGISLFKGGTIIPPPPGNFCDVVPPVVLPFGDSQTININGQQVQAISLGNNGQSGIFGYNFFSPPPYPYPATFKTNTGEIKFEVTLDSYDFPDNGSFGIFFIDTVAFQPIAGIQVSPAPTSGFLYDVVAMNPLVQTPDMPAGYTVALYLNTATGVARFKDNQGTNVIIASSAYNTANDIALGQLIASGVTGGQQITTTINFGGSAFVLGEDAERWCDYNSSIAFCSPMVLELPQPPIPVDQTIILQGTNNLEVLAQSLGNNDVQYLGVASTTQSFQTFTDEVKIEMYCTFDGTQYSGIGNGYPFYGLYFFHDLTTTPIPVAGALFFPTEGFFIDTIQSAKNSEDPITYPYNGIWSGPNFEIDQALYIDAIDQNKIYSFQVNNLLGLGETGTLDIHGVIIPIDEFDQQEDIAQKIIDADYSLVPIIDSVYRNDPTDSRNVAIKYTLAAGDATVVVTPSRPEITISENVYGGRTRDSRPYQIGAARWKGRNHSGGSIDERILAVSDSYDKSKPVYMVAYLNAGNVASQNMIQQVNFGSSPFLLDEDAERWCSALPSCDILTFSEFGSGSLVGMTATYSYVGIDSNGYQLISNQSFQATSGKVSVELLVESFSGNGTVNLFIRDQFGFTITGVYLLGDKIIGHSGGALTGSLSPTFGEFWMGVTLDLATGTATFSYKLSDLDSPTANAPIPVDVSFNNANPHVFEMGIAAIGNTSGTFTMNAGTEEWHTRVDGVGYCNLSG